MADGANLKDLLHSGNTEKLQAIRDAELQRYHMNKIVLDILKSGIDKKFEGSTKNLIRSLKILCVQDYIKLENDLTLLDLNDLKINLSYTEHKSIKNFVINEIKTQLNPLIEYLNIKKQEFPEIFNPENKHMEIIALEKKRRETILQLIDLKHKKLFLLKEVLDIKLEPYVQNALKLMRAEYKLNQEKINLLNNYMGQEFVGRSEYIDKAVKEIVRYMDAELEDK